MGPRVEWTMVAHSLFEIRFSFRWKLGLIRISNNTNVLISLPQSKMVFISRFEEFMLTNLLTSPSMTIVDQSLITTFRWFYWRTSNYCHYQSTLMIFNTNNFSIYKKSNKLYNNTSKKRVVKTGLCFYYNKFLLKVFK